MLHTVTFLMSKLGQVAHARFSDMIEALGLRPRHLGVLAQAARGGVSQQALAEGLRVAPSVVVDMVDELEKLGAVERVPDPADRRRHAITLTARGTRLLDQCTTLAHELDVTLLAPLTGNERQAFKKALTRLARANGVVAKKAD